MIKVHLINFDINKGIEVKENAETCVIRVEGHSALGLKGTDIVCSAVSAIVQSAIVSITKIAGLHQEISQKEGFIESVISIDESNTAGINALKIISGNMLTGLGLINENYPGTLQIMAE